MKNLFGPFVEKAKTKMSYLNSSHDDMITVNGQGLLVFYCKEPVERIYFHNSYYFKKCFEMLDKDQLIEKAQELISFYEDCLEKAQLLAIPENYSKVDVSLMSMETSLGQLSKRIPLVSKHVKANKSNFYGMSDYKIPKLIVIPVIDVKKFDFHLICTLPITLSNTVGIDVTKDTNIEDSKTKILDEIRQRLFFKINAQEKRIKKSEFDNLTFEQICDYIKLFEMIDY